MNKIENTEYFSYLKKFADGRLDIHTFVQKCYLDDMCNKIYETLFEEIPSNPILKDFVDTGVKLYYLLNNLNKQLNVHHWNENYDMLLISYISGRILNTFTDNDRIKNVDESQFADELLLRLENNRNNHILIEDVISYIEKEFKDRDMLSIKKESDYSVLITTKEPPPPNQNFSKYLRYLIENTRRLKQTQVSQKCAIRTNVLSVILDDTTPIPEKVKPLSKDRLFKLILGLELKHDEYSILISCARKEISKTKSSNKFDIDMNNPRDNLIMSFIERPLKEKNIIEAVNKRLEENGMDVLSP